MRRLVVRHMYLRVIRVHPLAVYEVVRRANVTVRILPSQRRRIEVRLHYLELEFVAVSVYVARLRVHRYQYLIFPYRARRRCRSFVRLAVLYLLVLHRYIGRQYHLFGHRYLRYRYVRAASIRIRRLEQFPVDPYLYPHGIHIDAYRELERVLSRIELELVACGVYALKRSLHLVLRLAVSVVLDVALRYLVAFRVVPGIFHHLVET